jgi:hypothetical protein
VSDPARGPGVFASSAAFDRGLLYVVACAAGCVLVILALPGRRRQDADRRALASPMKARG